MFSLHDIIVYVKIDKEVKMADVLGFTLVAGCTVLIIFLLVITYFIPSIIAYKRNHCHKLAIFFLNFLTGATGIGWVAAFIWAFVDTPVVLNESLVQFDGKPTIARELKELAQLKEKGIISEEEFETRKKKLLES